MLSLDNIFFAFIGWLAGILSPILVDLAREHRETEHLKKGILADLTEAQLICAVSFFLVRARLGKLDRHDLTWVHVILVRHGAASDYQNILKVLEGVLKLPDEKLLMGLQNFRSQPGMGLTIRRLETPFLQSHLGKLATFGPLYQRRILDISRRVRIFNEIGDDAKYYFRKTFESNISADNYARVNTNYDGCCTQIAEQAKSIADLIQTLAGDWDDI